MLKKTITFKDLDGNEITEDFYFSLSKAEIAEMELGHKGGFGAYLKRIAEAEDGEEIISTFKKILRKSVGRRSEDGRRFIKTDEIADEFIQTDAYSELFMELVTDAEAAAVFVRGLMPAEVEKQLPKEIETTPPMVRSVDNMTEEELREFIKGRGMPLK